ACSGGGGARLPRGRPSSASRSRAVPPSRLLTWPSPPPSGGSSRRPRTKPRRRSRRKSARFSAPSGNGQGASGGAWRRQAASSVAPISTDMDAPCVLAWRPQSLARDARPLLDRALVEAIILAGGKAEWLGDAAG